ncbi:unnamed protein product [Polarella glacialis]|uniref:phosphoribosyl-ATP diphosphatase n=1 Tax=Polarella glacialis TaxID=89957 RepID=A0A813LSP2_POLGL|nr:unnamed protein product [Polarella glacialis]
MGCAGRFVTSAAFGGAVLASTPARERSVSPFSPTGRNSRPNTIWCHEGASGFAQLDQLWATIQERKASADSARSWTSRLLAKGPDKCAQKVGEEATEVCIEAAARRHQGVVTESADLLFHLLVLWASLGIEPKQVFDELARREGLSGVVEKESRAKS